MRTVEVNNYITNTHTFHSSPAEEHMPHAPLLQVLLGMDFTLDTTILYIYHKPHLLVGLAIMYHPTIQVLPCKDVDKALEDLHFLDHLAKYL